MTKRDLHDRIIDQLLREILGGDRPRDMTARVMHQAKVMDRFRKRRWIGIGSALAASLALLVGVYFYWPHDYPNPTIGPEVQVAQGGKLERGQTLYTDADPGRLSLGGYVYVEMAPQTQLNLGGSKYQEKVVLSQGELDVDVTKHTGEFDVAVGPATVHVTGTKFNVRLGEENTPTEWRKVLRLAVKEGSVEVQNLPGAGTDTVTTGGEKTYVLETVKRNLSAGLLSAAQQAAAMGARGGLVNTVRPRQGLNAAPLQGPAPARATTPTTTPEPTLVPLTGDVGANRPVQLLTTPAAANRIGHVLRSGTVFYLEAKEGNFFMFERGGVLAQHPDWVNVPAEQYTRVVWLEGTVSRMERYAPASTTAPSNTTQH